MKEGMLLAEQWLVSQGLPAEYATWGVMAIAFTLLVAVAVAMYFLVSRVLIYRMHAIAQRTKTELDDLMLQKGFFYKLSRLLPGLLVYFGAALIFPADSAVLSITRKCVLLYLIYAGIGVLNALVAVVEAVLDARFKEQDQRPALNSVLGAVRFLTWAVGAILAIAVCMEVPPAIVIGGLGTVSIVTAIFLQQPVNRFISGFELEKIVRVGDWLTLPAFAITGRVQKQTLSDVTLELADKTTVNIPVGDMRNTRIVKINHLKTVAASKKLLEKSLLLDPTSVDFVSGLTLDELKELPELKTFFEGRNAGEQLTNLTVFRAYAAEAMKRHPLFSADDAVTVTQGAVSAQGVAVDFRAYFKEPDGNKFLMLQSDIFDVLLAKLRDFELLCAQAPTAESVREVAGSYLGAHCKSQPGG